MPTNSNYDTARLPAHLEPDTLDNLKPEEVVFVNPDDISVLRQTNDLFVYGCQELPPDSRAPATLMGRIAIMRVMIIDPDTRILSAVFVADLRRITRAHIREFNDALPADAPDDTDEATMWLEEKAHERQIVATVSTEPFALEDEITVEGDDRFLEAAIELARIVDRYSSLRALEEDARSFRGRARAATTALSNRYTDIKISLGDHLTARSRML